MVTCDSTSGFYSCFTLDLLVVPYGTKFTKFVRRFVHHHHHQQWRPGFHSLYFCSSWSCLHPEVLQRFRLPVLLYTRHSTLRARDGPVVPRGSARGGWQRWPRGRVWGTRSPRGRSRSERLGNPWAPCKPPPEPLSLRWHPQGKGLVMTEEAPAISTLTHTRALVGHLTPAFPTGESPAQPSALLRCCRCSARLPWSTPRFTPSPPSLPPSHPQPPCVLLHLISLAPTLLHHSSSGLRSSTSPVISFPLNAPQKAASQRPGNVAIGPKLSRPTFCRWLRSGAGM